MTNYTFFLLSLKLLLKNYKIDYITEISYNYEDYFLHWYVKSSDNNLSRHLHISSVFKNYIKESLYRLKPRFIIFPIVLHDTSPIYNPNYRTNINLNHLVVFIYNLNSGTIEYFDPTNNKIYYDASLLPDVFIKFLTKNYKDIKINHYITINESEGIQTIQEKELDSNNKVVGYNIGLCAIYIIWFIEKKVMYNFDNSNKFIKKELQELKNLQFEKLHLTNMIMNYKENLLKMCKSTINAIKLNKEYYENEYIDIELIIDLIHSFEDTYISSNLKKQIW